MGRLQGVILLIFLTSCGFDDTQKVNSSSLRDISYSAIYYNRKLSSYVDSFVKMNHQDLNCENELLRRVYSLYELVDSMQYKLVKFTGSFHADGSLLMADKNEVSGLIMTREEFRQTLSSRVDDIIELSAKNDFFGEELVLDKVKSDVRLFDFEAYHEANIDDITVTHFYNDLLLVKSSLLFTEFMYFEMLISNDLCKGRTPAPNSEVRE